MAFNNFLPKYERNLDNFTIKVLFDNKIGFTCGCHEFNSYNVNVFKEFIEKKSRERFPRMAFSRDYIFYEGKNKK